MFFIFCDTTKILFHLDYQPEIKKLFKQDNNLPLIQHKKTLTFQDTFLLINAIYE